MTLSYLQASLDKLADAARDDVIEICINPDGTCWAEFQGDHFMRRL
ncbi:MAG: type II secretion system protein E, partial [Pseudomonadota bacterium]